MGTRGYIVHRFRGRYYVQFNQYDSYYEVLGVQIVTSIPSNNEEYQKWLKATRDYYAAKEKIEDETTFVMHSEDGGREKFNGNDWQTVALLEPDDLFIEYCYIINLDSEVLTMQYGIHWDLRNIPREENQWMKAVCDSLYHFKVTINPEICGPEHMGSPAIPLREPEWLHLNDCDLVSPRSSLDSAAMLFLSHCAAKIFSHYNVEMTRFAREWEVDSFTLREFVFAFVSITSGQVSFLDMHKAVCDKEICQGYWCECQRFLRGNNWFDESIAGDLAPLPVFGTMHHLPDKPAGASPTATTYWHQNVAVHISLVVDGRSIDEAIAWGVGQGRSNFQLVVISGFKVAFAEVSQDKSGKQFTKVTKPLYLSPLRHENCLSTHPLERPVCPEGHDAILLEGDQALLSNCFGTKRKLETNYPGICALANFFDIAQKRTSTAKISHRLPMEVFDRIIDCVEYDTWKICQTIHHKFRSVCLSRFRIDSTWSIVSNPVARKRGGIAHGRTSLQRHLLSFEVEDSTSGKVHSITQVFRPEGQFVNSWVPLIGDERKVIMMEIKLDFKATADSPLEDGGDDVGLYVA